jgi:hypothetical protein
MALHVMYENNRADVMTALNLILSIVFPVLELILVLK